MATPAVPGAINITDLTGDEVVSLQSGAGSTQTTTQDIANLGGGGGTTGPTGSSGTNGTTGPTGSPGSTGATGAGGGGSSAVLSTGDISLSSAQILALYSSPVLVIAAPGAGKMIAIDYYVLHLATSSIPYMDTSDGQQLFYGPGPYSDQSQAASVACALLSSATAPQTGAIAGGVMATQIGGGVFAVDPTNQAVYFGNDIADMTAGNGTASITVFYSMVTL